ncbi:cytochrome P450 71A1-like [Salvia hispanica]|uniref:cytochrome P450 71A1-like n=1 Tax=Salvia hispanica TaxID=49212 RepID=UPI002009C155|nr:cytochrome P450 71A1-like [Salvia hispanica]
MTSLLILLLILPISILFHLLHKKTHQTPPGPRGLPFIGNLLHLATPEPHVHLCKLSRTYGPLMSLNLGSKPTLIVSSPRITEQVMRTHDLAFCSRPKLLGQHKLFYNGLDVAFAPYGHSWREMRKICVVHLLSNKRVQSFRPVREEEVFGMTRELSRDSGRVVNLSAVMLGLTSTLICRIAFGKGNSKRERFDVLMIEAQAMQAGFAFVSDYFPWLGWVDRLRGMVARLEQIYRDMDDFVEQLICEHLDPSWPHFKNPNILDLLIQLKNENSSSTTLTWDHVKAILMDIFVAATDTSAATVIWAMTALVKKPAAMERLQKEIRELVGDRTQVNEDDLPKLAYLKAVIKETLRLFPAAPLLLPRESMSDCKINGYTIPAKTLVFINAWAIGRDPESWENPDEFMPERFLNSSIDILGTDFEVIPFGAGRRGCPGIAMGLATVELTLANLLHSFDWEFPPGVSKEDIDTQVLPGLTMHKKHPLCLVPINRTHG